MINNITNNPADLFNAAPKSDKTQALDKTSQNTQGSQVSSNKNTDDQVTLGSSTDPVVTYNKPLNATQQTALKFQMTQQLVISLTLNQSAAGAISGGNNKQSINDLVSQIFGKLGLSTTIDIGGGQTADLKTMTPEDAQKLVADDGYWGVDKTSSRIVDFAMAQIGNDPSKLGKVKDAIMKGFDEAKQAFGGQLPDISQKTIDAVMSKLDKLTAPAVSQ